MKFKQFSITQRYDGAVEVSVMALFAAGEAFDGVLDVRGELASYLALGSRDASPAEMEDVGDAKAETPIETRRRRHRNPLEPSATVEGAPAAAVEEAAPEAPANPPSRRRRAAAPAETTPPASGATTTDAPASEAPRRRRRSETATETAPPSNTAPASEPAPTRRRRAASAESEATKTAPSNATSPTDAISDADLSKACSEAARVLTPKVVVAYLETFGAKHAGELKAAVRRKFLDGLKAKKEKAS